MDTFFWALGKLGLMVAIVCLIFGSVSLANGIAMGHGFAGLTKIEFWQSVLALWLLVSAIGCTMRWELEDKIDPLKEKVESLRWNRSNYLR